MLFRSEVSKIAQRNKFKEAVTKMMQPQPVTSVDPQAAASTAAMPEGAFSVKPDLLPSITTMKTPDIDPRKILIAGLENTGEPEYAKQLVELAKVKDQRPITLAPGGVAINPVTGLPMFSNPAKKERPISVAPGGSAVDPVTGEIIYTSPAKPQRPITVAPGGVVVDPDTLQPQYTNPNKTAADKPPIGYRATPDGNLEPVPGGPADFKKQQQFTKDKIGRASCRERV